MPQSEDPEFAAALRRICKHKPTQADIDMLGTRVGAPLDYPSIIPIVIRRPKFRTALSAERLQESSQASGIAISRCSAKVIGRPKISLADAYSFKGGAKSLKGDGVLTVIHRGPLLITQNINTSLDKLFLLFSISG